MKKRALSVIVLAALALASCGSDSTSEESPAADESTDDESTDDESTDDVADEPGLSDAEIGDDTMEVLGSYDIDGDQLEDGVDGPPPPEVVETFAIYTDLIPAEYREGVIAFVAIDQEASGGTDGAMQDVSGPDGEPTGERYLALDTSGSSVELERTIVHETGHLIFVTPGSDSNPYQDAFNELFPPGADYDTESFVTEYAASDSAGGEDIAESWAMYVYAGTDFAGDADDDGELDAVPGGTLAEEKVAFFEDYPELIDLKNAILG